MCKTESPQGKQHLLLLQKSLPYPVVLPELVLREDGRRDITPLVLFSSFLHRFLVAFLGLSEHMVKVLVVFEENKVIISVTRLHDAT